MIYVRLVANWGAVLLAAGPVAAALAVAATASFHHLGAARA